MSDYDYRGPSTYNPPFIGPATTYQVAPGGQHYPGNGYVNSALSGSSVHIPVHHGMQGFSGQNFGQLMDAYKNQQRNRGGRRKQTKRRRGGKRKRKQTKRRR